MPELTPSDMIKLAEQVEFTQRLAESYDQLQSWAEKKAAEQDAYLKYVPGLVDTMVDSGIIDFHQKEATLRALESPVTAIKVMKKLARRVGPVDLGAPADDRVNPSSMDDFTRFIVGDV